MNVLVLQLDIAWEQPHDNYDRVAAMLAQVTVEPGTLIVLPEMFSTGFSVTHPALPSDKCFLQELSQRYQSFVTAGCITHEVSGKFNTAFTFSPEGKEIGAYKKIRLFTYGEEAKHFSSGQGVQVIDLQGVKVAVFICYDLRFPELFREASRQGAEVFVVVASWPESRASHWVALLKARAIENQAYVIGSNRVGSDPYVNYRGRSLVVDPKGEVIADGEDKVAPIAACLNLEELREWRREFPALSDFLSADGFGDK